MRKELVEIYSDASNYTIMRHPARKFPGSLVQGDTLSCLCSMAEGALEGLSSPNGDRGEALEELAELAELLRGRLDHYASVLREHDLELPYFE